MWDSMLEELQNMTLDKSAILKHLCTPRFETCLTFEKSPQGRSYCDTVIFTTSLPFLDFSYILLPSLPSSYPRLLHLHHPLSASHVIFSVSRVTEWTSGKSHREGESGFPGSKRSTLCVLT